MKHGKHGKDTMHQHASDAASLLQAHNQVKRERAFDAAGQAGQAERYGQAGQYGQAGYVGQAMPETRATSNRPSIAATIAKNFVYILCVASVVAVVAAGIIFVRPLLSGETPLFPEQTGFEPAYDWRNLKAEGDRISYVVDGQTKSRFGIDVSENQHWINWEAVKADGVEFAIIRLGYRGATAGDLYLDEYYERNLAAAKAAGLEVGVYFFSQANSIEEAREEADYVLEHLKGAKLDCPVAFDSEEIVLDLPRSRTTGLDTVAMTNIANAFCERIAEAGYTTMVYGNGKDLSRYRRVFLETEPIWFAEYEVPAPTAKVNMVYWQYSHTGRVNGIDGAVDLNVDLSPAIL